MQSSFCLPTSRSTSPLVRSQLAASVVDREFARIVDELTRRGFLRGAGAAVAALGLAACSDDDSATPTPSTGPWRYTDDDGNVIDLPAVPQRIVATHDSIVAALWPAGIQVIGAPMIDGNLPDLYAAGVPKDGITPIYNGTELNLEALLGCKPDLIIVQSDGKQSPMLTAEPKVADVAPVACLNIYSQSVEDIIDSVHRLGAALEIPPADTAAKNEYQATAEKFKTAVAAKPGIRVLWAYGDDSELGAYVADGWSFGITLTELGLQFPRVGKISGATMNISWENMPSAPIDIVVWSAGTLPTNAAWKTTPAVKAGQYLDLSNVGTGYNYADFAKLLDTLTTVVQRSKVLKKQ